MKINKILKENTEIMQLWMKNNPKKAEDFLRFKEVLKRVRNQNIYLFL
jgi:LPS sulfotransferase NodH